MAGHLPQHPIFEAPQMRGEAVEVGRVEVQRLIGEMLRPRRRMLVIVSTDHAQTVSRACSPCRRRVKHRMQPGRHHYRESEPPYADAPVVGG